MTEVCIRSDDANQLDTIFKDPRQRSSLKKLKYCIILPSFSVTRWGKLPSSRECAENNTIFSSELRSLFNRLHTYEIDGGSPFCLQIEVLSPMESHKQGSATVNEGTGPDRNNNTYIKFDSQASEPLLTLTSVKFLEQGTGRNLHPTAMGRILRSLPAVEIIRWYFMGPEVRLHELRMEIRSALAQTLSTTELSYLKEFQMEWNDAEVFNHSFQPRSLLNPQTGEDYLSIALRKVAQLPTMKALKLTGSFILSSEFFKIEGSGNGQSAWPSLEIVHLQLSTMTPGGGWFYTGDPDSVEADDEPSYDSEEEQEHIDSTDSDKENYPAVWDWIKLNGEQPNHMWRNRPDPEIYNRFLVDMITSTSQMPALQNFTLQMGSTATSLVTDFEYRIAGLKSSNLRYISLESDKEVFEWPHWDLVLTQVTSIYDGEITDWEISDDLKQAIRNVAGSESNTFCVRNGNRLVEI